MTNILIPFANRVTLNTAASNVFNQIGSGTAVGIATVETLQGQITWETAGTFSNLYCNVNANTTTAAGTIKFRNAAANKNQVLTIGSGATGEFQDVTNTDAIAAGDKIDINILPGATGVSMGVNVFAIQFAPTTSGNAVNKLMAGNSGNLLAGATAYFQLGGQLNSAASTTEANTQFKNKQSSTLGNLSALVMSNTVSAATAVATRINTAAGNQSLSVTASTTGQFTDTTHTDSVVSGDLMNYQVVVGGTGTAIAFSHISAEYTNTSGYTHYVNGASGSAGLLVTTGSVSPLTNFVNGAAASEAAFQTKANLAFTVSNLETFVISNTNTASLNLRKNAANANSLITIGSGGIGYFEDTTHSDSIVSTDELNYKWTAVGTLRVNNLGFLALYPSGTITINSWYPSVNFTPTPIVPPYVFMGSLADEVLNLPVPFLPHLPDIAPPNPPAPPSSVAMNLQTISASTPLRFLPQISDAPRLTAADRPNFFSPIFPLNFRLPWLPARGVDAPPIVPPDKPNYFAPSWLLNLPMPWQARIVDAAPRALAAVPNFFAGIPAIISIVTSIPWFPRVTDAPRLTPADKPNYFAPRWLLNLPVPWMQKISTDAPPLTPVDKPNIFSPIFALNFRLPWLPRISDAPPVTPPAKPNFFAGIPALNFRLPWLPRISDAPRVTPPDRPSIFSFPLSLNFRLPWLPRVSEGVPPPTAAKQSIFSPPWTVAAVASWFTRFVSADAPKLPIADKPNFFLGTLRFIPGSGVFGRIIDPLRQNRTVSPKMQSRTVDATHQNRTLNPDSDGRILDPRSQKRIL